MLRKFSLIPFTLCALALAPSAIARFVFVMPPGDGILRPVSPFVGDPFQAAAGGIAAAQDTFVAFSTPTGNKFYFVGRSSTDTVVITDSNYNVIGRRSLGIGASAAAMSPDGRFLVVAAGTIQIINTSTDQVVTQIDGGSSPNDVAVSRDSTRAFVTSQSSGRVTAVDLNSFSTAGTQQNLGPVNGVNVGPNGLVYVSATNILYEFGPSDLSLRGGTGISMNGQPGKPYFTTDDFGTVRVIMVNLNPAFGGSSLLTVDLGTRGVTPLNAGGIILDKLVPVSSTRIIATSQSQQLYDINLPNSIAPAAFSGLASTNGVRSAVASNEVTTARFLYLAFASTNSIARIDLSANSLSGSFPLPNQPGLMSYTGPAYTGLPTRLITINNNQFVSPSAQTAPLIIRAVDANGNGLSGVPVQFTNATAGSTIVSATASTDSEGYAQAVALAPSTFGQFSVTVNAGSGVVVSAVFNLTVGTGQVGPTGAVTVKSGNGQIIRESGVTPDPLRVVVRDTSGNPVPFATVNWIVSSSNGPTGSLSTSQSTTDANGEATNTYIAPIIGPNLFTGFVQATVTASTSLGSVNMFVTTIPTVFGNNPASFPSVQVLAPVNTSELTAQAGTTLTAAIQVRVTAGSGPASGTPIPNVGLNVTTGLDPAVGPTAACRQDNSLTDSTGLANCDLIIGSKIGPSTPLSITVGGSSISTLNLTVTPGLPGKITVMQGDNQTGAPGATLPLALLARVEDSFGNALANVPVNWTVDSGSATLFNTISRTDSFARISTLVRLGNTPGPVKIRITAQGGTAAATAVFTATVTVSATQIRYVSGDAQSTIVNQPFADPLVAQVLDPNGQGVPNITVTFTVTSGSVSLGSQSTVSDSSGFVRTTVTAAGTAGSATVTANFAGNSVPFNLTIRPLGPTLTPAGVTNAASGQTAIAPGSTVTIRGSNIVPAVRGYVLPQFDFGPRPTTLAGVAVSFGGIPAPIFWVANVDGQEAVTVQVPFEVQDNATIPVTVTSNGTQASVNVAISTVAPGIFENVDSQNRRYAVVTRSDGTFVTPDNPATRGDLVHIYTTGLGRTIGAAATNSYGVGQRLVAAVIVGLNNAGVDSATTTAEYAANLIGIYVVSFRIPQDAATGTERDLAVAVDAGGGNLIFGNGSVMAVR